MSQTPEQIAEEILKKWPCIHMECDEEVLEKDIAAAITRERETADALKTEIRVLDAKNTRKDIRIDALEEGLREAASEMCNRGRELYGEKIKLLLVPKAAPASACICEDYEEGGKVFNPNCPEAAEHKAPEKCEHDMGEYWQFSVNPEDGRLKENKNEKCPKCPAPAKDCESCGGDGVETCGNPDHGFIDSGAAGRDAARIGCPVCGHNPNYKVKDSKCPDCNGTGKAPAPKEVSHE